MDYVKEEGRRDDWLQCLVGAEIVAVAKGLDKIQRRKEDATPRTDAPPRSPRVSDTRFGRRGRTGRFRQRRRGRI